MTFFLDTFFFKNIKNYSTSNLRVWGGQLEEVVLAGWALFPQFFTIYSPLNKFLTALENYKEFSDQINNLFVM